MNMSLIEQFRAGHSDAGNELLKNYEPYLRLLARVQMESRFTAKFDAADLAQQTMIAAVRDFPNFRGNSDAEFAAWLRQILAHVLAHEIRRYHGTQKRDLSREVSLDQTVSESAQRLADMLPATATSPTQAVVRHERQVHLARALDQLPADYREVIVLRHLEGLSHEQIAARLGRNPGAIRMLWVRALARLRAVMQQIEAELATRRLG
jgi:RNA polymerase sigma-70 factor (ECF subfamily)